MATTKEQMVIFNNVGNNDHIPYSKVDVVKVSRMSDNFAFSFYQIDYQAMANKVVSSETVEEGIVDNSDLLMPVGKMVLDRPAFLQFYSEIAQIKESIDVEHSKK